MRQPRQLATASPRVGRTTSATSFRDPASVPARRRVRSPAAAAAWDPRVPSTSAGSLIYGRSLDDARQTRPKRQPRGDGPSELNSAGAGVTPRGLKAKQQAVRSGRLLHEEARALRPQPQQQGHLHTSSISEAAGYYNGAFSELLPAFEPTGRRVAPAGEPNFDELTMLLSETSGSCCRFDERKLLDSAAGTTGGGSPGNFEGTTLV
eukprot:6196171-Prymnesium_polylepis.1